MGFFYSILNIFVPITLLTYRSLLKFNSSSQIPFGKWVLLTALVYLFDWISWIFDESYIIYFLDLLLKIAVSFIPDAYNSKIETLITNSHLEIWFDQLRCWVIGGFHKYYWKTTQFILHKMENDESQQFRQALLHNLKGEKTTHHDHFAFKPVKTFVNIGVNCDKVNEQIAQNISSTAKKLQEYSKKIVQDKNLHNQTFGQIKPTKQVSQKPMTQSAHVRPIAKVVEPKKEELPKFTYKKKEAEVKVVKELPELNLNLRASQQDIDFSDEQDVLQDKPLVISPINKKTQENVGFRAVSKKTTVESGLKNQGKLIGHKFEEEESNFKRAFTFTDQGSTEFASHSDSLKKAYRQDGQAFKQDLIDKLQLSSSEYSGMFDQEDVEDQKTLECKVQVILQIGSGTAARLEIYNMELYSNRDVKIVSLYGREFENHKLKAMRKLPNNYYELIFDEGKIGSRKCKFRGANQPFMKYLVEN